MRLIGGFRPIVKPKPLAITPKHSKDQVKILRVEANRVRYSTHIDNFYFVRYAKIQHSKNVTSEYLDFSIWVGAADLFF